LSAEDPIVGATFAERYRVLGKLGEGGMGAVYEVLDSAGARFALKVIHREIAAQNQEAVARFFQESRASAGLSSPHIVSTVDSGTDARLGTPFLVMELLSGENVRDLIDRVGPLDPSIAVRIAVDAARGLSAAHAAGIVHRDIKPENLFLASSASDEVTVKVCDFRVAKVTGPDGYQLTQTGHLLGSAFYMSPEQCRSSKHVDLRSDVWNLAVTLYEMLSGRTPCNPDANSFAELLVEITSTQPKHIQDVAPWIEPDLAIAVHRGLVPNVAERCPSMPLFEASLSRFARQGSLAKSSFIAVPAEARGRDKPRATLSVWRDEPEAARGGADVDHLIGTVLAGRYRLERLLGRGGMGAVYEAKDERENQRVAIKVILAESSPRSSDTRRRFVREARAASSIANEHVVRVLDADTDPVSAMPFIVMELLSGIDLDQLIGDKGPVEPMAVARLCLQACEGLSTAHSKSLVHRDIKPANLFLHQVGDDVTVKLCDFGVAKNTAAEAVEGATAGLTRTGGLLGSPLYMSPEQAKNAKHVDARSDIWSLCLTMYQALSGIRPWDHCSTIGELILAICTEDVAPLREVSPWVDERLAAIVDRGLERNADERWSSVDELSAALRRFVGADARLTRGMLTSVADELRAGARAPRRPGSASAHAPTVAAESAGVEVERRPRGRSRRTGWLVGVASIVLLGAASAVALRQGHESRVEPEAVKAVAPESPPPARPTDTSAHVEPPPPAAIAPKPVETAAPSSVATAAPPPAVSARLSPPIPKTVASARRPLPPPRAPAAEPAATPTAAAQAAKKPDFQKDWE